MTFEELCRMEPWLVALYNYARYAGHRLRRGRPPRADKLWRERIWPHLRYLMGPGAKHPLLRTPEARSLAVGTILHALRGAYVEWREDLFQLW